MNGISGISKAALQMSAGMKTDGVSKEMEESITASFMELMNQNALSGNVDASVDESNVAVGGVAREETENAYEFAGTVEREVKVKEDTTVSETDSEFSEQMESYEDDVREVLKNELGVTDEEITMAMDALGLNFSDLMNRQNLTALIQNLTGEDVGTLFLSEAFQNIMAEVTELTDSLCSELGISKEELVAMCERLTSTDVKTDVEFEKVPDDMVADTVNLNETTTNVETSVKAENGNEEKVQGLVTEEASTDITTQAEAVPEETTLKNASQEKEEKVVGSELENLDDEIQVKEVEMQTSSENENAFEKNSSQSETPIIRTEMGTTAQPSQQAIEFLVQDQNVQAYTTQNVNVADIIEQVAKNVRVTLSAGITTMEMQLNPENLGRLHLSVSETEGVVHAKILTQTEIVKEALEMQLADLRQSLNQQGVKVDAIEITVATHEFEQNLDGSANQQEQMQQQMEETQKQARRNLNLNDLEGLQEVMSEDEALAAQIMKDNGNQVDFTA